MNDRPAHPAPASSSNYAAPPQTAAGRRLWQVAAAGSAATGKPPPAPHQLPFFVGAPCSGVSLATREVRISAPGDRAATVAAGRLQLWQAEGLGMVSQLASTAKHLCSRIRWHAMPRSCHRHAQGADGPLHVSCGWRCWCAMPQHAQLPERLLHSHRLCVGACVVVPTQVRSLRMRQCTHTDSCF
jgi:hypothetical protein